MTDTTTPPHRPDVSAELYEITIAQAIEAHNPFSSEEPLEELRVQKWVMITERKRKKRLRQARAVIDLIKSSPDASAGLIEAAEFREAVKRIKEQIVECRNAGLSDHGTACSIAVMLTRSRAADRSEK